VAQHARRERGRRAAGRAVRAPARGQLADQVGAGGARPQVGHLRAREASPRGDMLGFAVFSVFLLCSHVVGPQGRHLRRARQAPLLMAILVVIPRASSTSRHV